MVCQPSNTLNGGSSNWIAYAYVDHWLSVYKGDWCTYPSAQMHEIGHNLNLAHSGEGSGSYDDQSCMVSVSNLSSINPIVLVVLFKSLIFFAPSVEDGILLLSR
jgi:hypothetical protein